MSGDIPIAVVGIGCRYPGDSSNPEALWKVLSNGKSCYSRVPLDRYNIDAFQHPSNKINTALTQGAHFLSDDITVFDGPFFNIAPSDAKAMDPQQRMLLEVVYEGLENAGLPMEALAGSDTSCYVGSFTRDWNDLLMRDPEAAPKYSMSGIGSGMSANRVSWFFDWRGPSLTLDTACSSSLVALHLACQSIREGTSRVAVAGGTTLLFNPDIPMWMSNMNFLSKDGLSKSFDESADGYGRGEGISAVVLKSFEDAVRDGDCIRAVIRGSGVNQDGHTSGITLPNPAAQADLISSVYRKANLDYDDTTYFEAHGTGTSAGDAIEMMAIGKSIMAQRSTGPPLFVGSIKSNIGHTEGAAGLAGFIKAVLVLEKGTIPPNIHLKTLNPKIPFDKFNLQVPTSAIPWPSSGLRRASVNSFGYGGTNAHVIVDDAASYLRYLGLGGNHNTIDLSDASSSTGSGSNDSGVLVDTSEVNVLNDGRDPMPRLLVFSAHDEAVVLSMKDRYADYIKDMITAGAVSSTDREYLDKLAFTLFTRRSVLPWKNFVVADDLAQTVETLAARDTKPIRSFNKPRVAFVFTGQGAQWAGMGQELLGYPVFRKSVLDADEYLRLVLGSPWSALEELTRDAKASELHLAKFSQPLCTILQIALVDLLQSWGIEPVAVIGHSSGEIPAAVCTGAISREVGWKVAYWRGKLSSEMAITHQNVQGSMLAAGISAAQAQEYIAQVTTGRIQVACSNSPESVTISGDEAGVDEIDAILKSHGLFSRKLKVENAYHSYHMEHIAEEYLKNIADCTVSESETSIRMVSSVTGTTLDPKKLTPSYWVQNLTSQVQFSDALANLLKGDSRRRRRVAESSVEFLLEVGPHSALQGPAKQVLAGAGFKNVSYGSVLKRGKNAAKAAVEAVGTLFTHGLDVDINAVNQANDPTVVSPAQVPLTDLPTYPWNHDKSYWAESRISRAHRFRSHNRVDLLGAPVADVIEGDPAWRQFLRTSEVPWIRDHKIQSSVLYPGAGMLAMVLEATRQIADADRELDFIELRDVRLDRPMLISDGEVGIETKIQLTKPKTNSILEGSYEFKISSAPEGAPLELNCYGCVAIRYKPSSASPAYFEKRLNSKHFEISLLEKEGKCGHAVDTALFYELVEALGLQYGPAFQNLTQIRCAKKLACASVIAHDTKSSMPKSHEDDHILHPTTLDCMFQLLFAALGDGSSTLNTAAVPVFIQKLKVSDSCPRGAGSVFRGFAAVSASGLTEHIADLAFGSEDGSQLHVEITGLRCREIGTGSPDTSASAAVAARYGVIENAPDLRLASTSGLLNYLGNRDSMHDTVDASSKTREVLSQIIELVVHAEPHANILEITSDDVALTEQVVQLIAKAQPRSLRSTRWTVANLSVEARASLTAKTQESGAYVAFGEYDAYSTPPDSSTDAYDAIVISGQKVNDLDVDFLKSVDPFLKLGGYLLLVADNSSGTSLQALCLSVGFQRFLEVPVSGSWGDSSLGSVAIVSRKTYHEVLQKKTPVALLLPKGPSKDCISLANELMQRLESYGFGVQFKYLQSDSVDELDGTCGISLVEVDGFLPIDASAALFDRVKSLLLRSKRLLWVTNSSKPRFGVTLGVFRTVRNENPNLDLISMTLGEQALARIQQSAGLILETFLVDVNDKEFELGDGLCYVPRYVPESALDSSIASQLDKSASDFVMLGEVSVPLKLEVHSAGVLGSVYFEADRDHASDLLPDEVEIQAHAIGINSRDIMTLMGQVPDSFLGREASGTITRVGSAVSKFQPGDRVYQASPGSFRTSIRTKEVLCQRIPEGMTFADAASIAIAFVTALSSIRDLGKLRAGEKVLIHAAAGGVGQAAIQIAKHFGAEIFVTVGSAAKAQTLRDVYDIPEDHIFSSRDASFLEGVLEATGGEGVDVVLNSLHGELLRQTWHCLAPFGRFVEIGLKDVGNHASLEMAPFERGVSFASFNLNLIMSKAPNKLGALLGDVASLLEQGVVRPVHTISEYSATDLQAALRAVQGGEHVGKVLVTLSPSDSILAHPTIRNGLRLKSDAAYVIIGGLGGLGRSVALHMAECGAKHLAFLSRSGASDKNAEPLRKELERRGVNAIFHSCDVADRDQLQSALERYGNELPPIAGCVQGAMLLRDCIYENMTHADFQSSLRPKVQGSWNLHELLPNNLDFFIMLSSISGISGNPGQANYAAGNTFMDALAHYRHRQGLAATSLDLGLLLDVGFVAERQVVSNLRKWESVGLREEEFLLLMTAAMRGSSVPASSSLPASSEEEGEQHQHQPQPQPQAFPVQLVTGLATGGHVAQHSLEPPFYFSDPRFRQLTRAGLSGGAAGDAATDESAALHAALESAASPAQAGDVAGEAIRARLARMMDTATENIETSKPLHAYGVDSLMAVEMRNWLVKEMRCEISLFDVLGSASIADLGLKAAAGSKLVTAKLAELD